MNILNTAITKGVKVSAYPRFIASESKPIEGLYFHAYRITIENKGKNTIQLLNRHWNIHDSLMGIRTVKGAGIVGEQPILEPGQIHSYTSFCPLKSSIGAMDGYFQFENLETNDLFTVKIPHFELLMPGIYN